VYTEETTRLRAKFDTTCSLPCPVPQRSYVLGRPKRLLPTCTSRSRFARCAAAGREVADLLTNTPAAAHLSNNRYVCIVLLGQSGRIHVRSLFGGGRRCTGPADEGLALPQKSPGKGYPCRAIASAPRRDGSVPKAAATSPPLNRKLEGAVTRLPIVHPPMNEPQCAWFYRATARRLDGHIRVHIQSTFKCTLNIGQSVPSRLLELLPDRSHWSEKGRGGSRMSAVDDVRVPCPSSFVGPPGTGGASLVAFDAAPPPSPLAGTGADAPDPSSVVAAPAPKSTSYGSMRKSRRQMGQRGPSRCRSSHVSMQLEWKQWSHCRLLLQQMVSPTT
jgi:hypothetical protein